MSTHGSTQLPAVFTIGHSTRSLDAFLDLLHTHGVKHLIDVRTVPRSRFNPQFNHETFPQPLRQAGIDYSHLPELGGASSRPAGLAQHGMAQRLIPRLR